MSDALSSSRSPQLLRRPAARRRRRSRRVPRLAWTLLKALLWVAGPTALVLWIFASSYFSIREIEVTAGSRVSPGWALEALEPIRGEHVLTVSLAAIRQRLSHPWIDVVELRKQLPDRLVVTVAEREPVALWRRDGKLLYVDRLGEPIAPCPPGDGDHLLVLTGGHGDTIAADEALGVVEELRRLRPDWAEDVGELAVLGEHDFRIELEGRPWDLWVRSGRLGDGLRRLESRSQVLRELKPPATGIDLRFERRIVIRREPERSGSNEGPGVPGSEGTEG